MQVCVRMQVARMQVARVNFMRVDVVMRAEEVAAGGGIHFLLWDWEPRMDTNGHDFFGALIRVHWCTFVVLDLFDEEEVVGGEHCVAQLGPCC